jgi:hypothetical protein
MSDATETAAIPKVKVTINFPIRLWAWVEQMAKEEGVTRTELLRRAISLEKLRLDLEKEGSKLGVIDKDGTVERLHFSF